jgi:hypothetical protein
MAWDIEYTNEFGDWFASLDEYVQDAINGAVQVLEEYGPGLGRPLVDTLTSSRHRNMKELRPPIGNVRLLFAFDPRRTAIILLGGDKTNRWQEWYRIAIPEADRLYDEYLAELRKEGLIS